ncbi:MAG TPA: hypothetical protein ENG51_19715 [Deltaproteobacteria bacterium]|nr:hypothetical protein [Deltaproteobacteria bacterium]
MARKEAMLIARELVGKGKDMSADDLSRATKIPKWKVARMLKRFEKLGLVSVSDEVTFSVGRPRKLYSVTENGVKFFGEMGIEIFGIIKSEKSGEEKKA